MKQLMSSLLLCVFLCLSVSHQAFASDPNLVGSWTFDSDAPPTVVDSSAYGNNGTLHGATLTSAGFSGSCYSFDGVGNYIDAGTSASLNPASAVTMSAWIKPIGKGVTGADDLSVIGRGSNYFSIREDGIVFLYMSGVKNWTVSGGQGLFNADWHHFVATYDGTKQSIYIDGALIASTPATGTIAQNSSVTKIGSGFKGQIDSVRVYSVALTAQEVQALYLSYNPAPKTLRNLSFEEDLTYWDHQSSPLFSGQAKIEQYQGTTVEPLTNGTKYLTLTAGASTGWQAAYQSLDAGVLAPGNYTLSFWYKTSLNQEAYILLQDNDWKNASGAKVARGIDIKRGGTGGWQLLKTNITIPETDDFGEPTSTHKYMLQLLVSNPTTSKEPISYDSISLTPISGDPYAIVPFGPGNNAQSKTLDLGASDETISGITYTPTSALSAKATDSGTDYRILNSRQAITMQVPAFDVDAQGFPLNPMLLEVRYKDSINIANHAPADWPAWAAVESLINYQSDDPLSSKPLWSYYVAGSLGDKGDNAWKYNQIVFQKSSFQLLRAINGKFTIRIRMPSSGPSFTGYDAWTLPIDYISLRSITQEQADVIAKRQREQRGFWYFAMPQDQPASSVNYPSSTITTFARDMMHSIYSHTKPQLSEVDKPISSFSALGETEILTFGIYSKEGIQNLSFQTSDLTNSSGSKISAANLSVYQVVEDESKLPTPNYTTAPDRLEDVTVLSIPPQSSKRIWIKVAIPTTLSGGLYQGVLQVKQGTVVVKNVTLQMKVLPIKLDLSPQINPIYGDPFVKIISSKQAEVFKLYSEVGVDPFVETMAIKPITDGSGRVIDFDMVRFTAQIDEMVSTGFFKDKAVLNIGGFVGALFYKIYGRYGDVNLYDDLNNPVFKNAFILGINKIKAIGNQRNRSFVFSWGDEVGGAPYGRITQDRLYTYLKENGDETTANNHLSGYFDTPTTCRGIFQINGDLNASIPALNNLVDYKAASLGMQRENFDKGFAKHAYYTTGVAEKRNPIYNRFLHGLFAYRTNAKFVSTFAMSDYVGDPYDNFDADYQYTITLEYPSDYMLAYPTWSGKLLPTLGLEGLREGIKDSKYIATLERLIKSQAGSSSATQAQEYLTALKSRLSPYYDDGYYRLGNVYGHYNKIVSSVSPTQNQEDYEAFTNVRSEIASFIEALTARVNHPPITTLAALFINEDTPKSFALTANDADGDVLTYTVVTQPDHGSLSGAAPNLTYTPAAKYNGPDSFTYKASDGKLDSQTTTVAITVTFEQGSASGSGNNESSGGGGGGGCGMGGSAGGLILMLGVLLQVLVVPRRTRA